ncbi:major capsid protein [bacterium]|nr:major capsid protein [bacterium]
MDIFSTRTMLTAIDQLVTARTFLLQTFFPGFQQFASKSVDIDIIKGKRRIAPFVSPVLAGKVIDKRGFTTKTYTPPYVKPKFVTGAQEILNRAPGEIVYVGGQSQQNRAETKLGEEFAELDEMITRREEWMAAQELVTGSVSVVGDGINDVIDFQRSADHTVTLTGTALWTDAASKIIENLRTWRRKIIQDSGVTPNIVVMGSTAVDAFMSNVVLAASLDNRRVDLGKIDPTILPDGVTYYGYIKEVGLDLYGYDEWYLDDAGDEQPMLPADKVIVGSTNSRNAKLYGMIQDLAAGGNFAVPRFPKSWEKEDPSVRFVMLQSAPLVALLQPDSTMCIKVV